MLGLSGREKLDIKANSNNLPTNLNAPLRGLLTGLSIYLKRIAVSFYFSYIYSIESMVSTSQPSQRSFNPYTENGGTILAVAGADFSVIAGDTRQSEGYSIQTRYAPKVFRLYVSFPFYFLHPILPLSFPLCAEQTKLFWL